MTINSHAPGAGMGAPARAEHDHEATLRAELLQQGHHLHQLAGGGWLVSRWGLCRELPDLRAVRQFARQVGCLS